MTNRPLSPKHPLSDFLPATIYLRPCPIHLCPSDASSSTLQCRQPPSQISSLCNIVSWACRWPCTFTPYLTTIVPNHAWGATCNLNHTVTTVCTTWLCNALQKNSQNSAKVPMPYYQRVRYNEKIKERDFIYSMELNCYKCAQGHWSGIGWRLTWLTDFAMRVKAGIGVSLDDESFEKLRSSDGILEGVAFWQRAASSFWVILFLSFWSSLVLAL